MKVKGSVFRYGDNVDTDVIIPARYLNTSDPKELASHCMPITKHNYIVKDIADLAATIRNAFRIAKMGRPGPVLIDITKDVMTATCAYEKQVPPPLHRFEKRLSQSQMDVALKLLTECKRPMCYIGGGAVCSDASEQVRRFLDLLDSPACFSMVSICKPPSCGGRMKTVLYNSGFDLANFLTAMAIDTNASLPSFVVAASLIAACICSMAHKLIAFFKSSTFFMAARSHHINMNIFILDDDVCLLRFRKDCD